jgi:hypothetical protein
MDKNRITIDTSLTNILLLLSLVSFLLWLTHSYAVSEFLNELRRLLTKFVPGS